jgi:cytochrome P450
MTETDKRAPTIDYDHRDDDSRLDPWPRWQEMREHNPIFFSEQYGGFYVLSRYADVTDAARNPDVFASGIDGTTIPKFPTPLLPPLHADPPEQREWREILNPYFSPSKISEYEPWISELVDEMVAPLLANDRLDIPRDIGVPLTRTVILRIMGIETAPADLNHWTDQMVFGIGEDAQHGSLALMQFLGQEIALRRAQPRADFITALFTARRTSAEQVLDDEEVLKLLLLVLAAALETTSSAIAATVAHLLDHPDDAARLQNEPGLWRGAMDEFVRWASPAACLARTTRQDTEVDGCPIPAGSRVLLLYGSSNHDEGEFPDADSVVLDRVPNRHLGFGMGPHRCLGSHLAKAQMRLVLRMLLPTLHQWRIADPAKIQWTAAVTRGMTSLPLVRR